MKRILYIAATVLFVATGCNKVEPVIDVTPEVITPVETAASFTASLSDAVQTKISMQTGSETWGKIYWAINDLICINGVNYKALAGNTESSGFNPETTGQSASMQNDKYYAFYPYTLFNDGSPALPSTLTYSSSAPSKDFPMFAVSGNTSLSFKNICGIIQIHVSGSKSLRSIQLSATNAGMSGQISNYSALKGDPTTAAAVEGTSPVTLNFTGDGISISDAKDFYIPVPAGSYSGFSVTFTATDNTTVTKTYKNTLSIARNTVQPITFTSITFPASASTGVTTYYNTAGEIPATTANKQFRVENASWQLVFSDINFAAGDYIETKFDAKDDMTNNGKPILMLGPDDGWKCANIYCNNWNTSSAYIMPRYSTGNGGNYYSGSGFNCLSTHGVVSARIDEYGIWFSLDDFTTETLVADASQYTTLATVLAMGTSADNTICIGSFHPHKYDAGNLPDVTYYYFKIVRGGVQSAIHVSDIEVTPSAIEINIDENTSLSVAVKPQNASNKNITWASSKPEVVSVTSEGIITGISVGEATVTATALDGSGIQGTCSVSVTNEVHDPDATGPVIYFGKSGKRHATPYEFVINDAQFQFSIPGNYYDSPINWSGGDYLEAKITYVAGSQSVLFIGENDTIFGKKFISVDTDGNWAHIVSSKNGKCYSRGSLCIYVRLTNEGLYGSTDGNTWTGPLSDAGTQYAGWLEPSLDYIRALPICYVGAYKTNVNATYNYIKLVKGNGTSSSSGGSSSPGEITSTETSW